MAERECSPQWYALGHGMEPRSVDADSDYSNSKVLSSEVISSEVTGLAAACA